MTAGVLLFSSNAHIVCSILPVYKCTKVTLKSKIKPPRDVLKAKTQEEFKASFSLDKIKIFSRNQLTLIGATSKPLFLNIAQPRLQEAVTCGNLPGTAV